MFYIMCLFPQNKQTNKKKLEYLSMALVSNQQLPPHPDTGNEYPLNHVKANENSTNFR